MIEDAGTQQNYFYPYDLFSYYANLILKELDRSCTTLPYPVESTYRYVYLNRFFDHVAEEHRSDINILLPKHERIDY